MTNTTKEVTERVKEIREYAESHFQEIAKMTKPLYEAICLFSLVESFAQEYSDYPKGNAEAFCVFLLKFAKKKYPELDMIDPVTFRYALQGAGKKIVSIEKWYEKLTPGYEYTWKDIATTLDFKKVEKEVNSQISKPFKNHKYVELIYKYRCKLSHEFAPPIHIFKSTYPRETPSYYYGSLDKNEESDKHGYNLYFPNGFLHKVFACAIFNYLNCCETEARDPFKNRIKRGFYKSWYE